MQELQDGSASVVVYEKTATGCSAYVPDLPGCISNGASLPETKKNMQEAITGHLAVMQEFGDPIPPPTTVAARMLIPA